MMPPSAGRSDPPAPPDPAALETHLAAGPARLGVLGMGYVGVPLMLAAVGAGLDVTGFDTDPHRVDQLNAGLSPLAHIGHAKVAAAVASGRFRATGAMAELARPDALLICVPTPLGPHREPDLRFVETTARAIAAALRPGQLVVLESTTWPGTTAEVVRPILEAAGLRVGVDVFLAFGPEREDPGNDAHPHASIPKVVGADDPASLALASALYGRFTARVVRVSSAATAEAVKLTENVFRAVNIALVNELKLVFTALGIDVVEVIEAAATKPFGFMAFRPGPGLGGHCIPIDPFYLAWRAKAAGQPTRFIELAGEVNRAMPDWVLARLAEAIDRRTGKGLSASRVLLLGMAYKKDVDDVRESPGLALLEALLARGADTLFHDPHVGMVPPTREHGGLAGRESVPLTPALLAGVDAALVVTDHAAIDWAMVAAHAGLVVDTRGIMRRFGRLDAVLA